MPRKSLAIFLSGLSIALYALYALRTVYFEANECTMSWSRPQYVPLSFDSPNSKVSRKYGVYLYREGGLSYRFDDQEDVPALGGTPVVFLPGNAGTYGQGRSLASLAANEREFDWFLIDFDEDLSAMHGKTLLDEAEYVNDAIKGILSLYDNHPAIKVKPASVIVVGHSMGGLVARTIVALDNYIAGSVNTIVTLSTPHVYPPLTFDRDITQIYDAVNQFWRLSSNHNITLVSIAGGHNDLMVLPDTTLVDSLGGISAFSYEIPGVGIGIDHQAVVWCGELRNAVVNAISLIADHSSPQRTQPYERRERTLRALLKREREPFDNIHNVSHSIMFGAEQSIEISEDTDFLMPSKSSIVSYHMRSDRPVHVSHETVNEHRDYGVVNKSSIVWYSAGPYVPLSEEGGARLTLKVQPTGITTVRISVNWAMTLANIAIHYRSLAASWPLAIVLLTTLIVLRRKTSFIAAFSMFMESWYMPVSGVLILFHFLLCFSKVRDFVRAFQVPGETKTIYSLEVGKFDVHDILLGVNDPEMFWLIPALLAVACCAVLIVCNISRAVVTLHTLLIPGSAQGPSYSAQGPLRWILVTSLCFGLYLIPYQVSTNIMAASLLCRITDLSSFRFAYVQILLWTAAIDAPIVAVWLRNLSLDWLWAFATLRNVVASVPLTTLALRGSQWLPNARPLLFHITQVVILYIAAFAFMFGGLHAFMLHHLVNYLAGWFLVMKCGSSTSKSEIRKETVQ